MQLLSIRFPGFPESVGTAELLVVVVIALVVFGPRRLPEFGRSVGQVLGQVRTVSDDFMRAWEAEALREGGPPRRRELPTAAGGVQTRRALSADAPTRAAGPGAGAGVTAAAAAKAHEARAAATKV